MGTQLDEGVGSTDVLVDEIDRIVLDVHGWLDPFEGRLLFRLAQEADPAGAIVEIGSWQGRSTIWLAAGAKAGRGARVAAVDPHRGTYLREGDETTEPALRRNLARAGVDDQVDVIVATSEAAAATWERPVSLLWIDGDHEYESVRRDLLRWEEHLLPSAVVALHDTFMWPGPERVVDELLVGSRRYRNFEYADTTTAARRCERLTGRQVLALQGEVIRRKLYGIRLRAYDANRFGYARFRDAIGRLARR
jgi:predicted O-methyltransferase YrrM